jgi:hypothetical protein
LSSSHDQSFGEIRHDRLQAALRHVLLVHDNIVEDPHHWAFGCDRRFLVDRHARRAVEKIEFQNATRFLGKCRLIAQQCAEQRASHRQRAQISRHLPSASV